MKTDAEGVLSCAILSVHMSTPLQDQIEQDRHNPTRLLLCAGVAAAVSFARPRGVSYEDMLPRRMYSSTFRESKETELMGVVWIFTGERERQRERGGGGWESETEKRGWAGDGIVLCCTQLELVPKRA